MSRVEENANVIKQLKAVNGRDFDEINAKLLNDIRSVLIDISVSLAVIADSEHMKTLSAVTESDSLTHNEKRWLANRILECMKRGDLDGAAKEINDQKQHADDIKHYVNDLCKEIINMQSKPNNIGVAKAAAKAIINYSQLFLETYENNKDYSNCQDEEENSDG